MEIHGTEIAIGALMEDNDENGAGMDMGNSGAIYFYEFICDPGVDTIIDSTICYGGSVIMNNINAMATGTYLDTIYNQEGCDSLYMVSR